MEIQPVDFPSFLFLKKINHEEFENVLVISVNKIGSQKPISEDIGFCVRY